MYDSVWMVSWRMELGLCDWVDMKMLGSSRSQMVGMASASLVLFYSFEPFYPNLSQTKTLALGIFESNFRVEESIRLAALASLNLLGNKYDIYSCLTEIYIPSIPSTLQLS